MTHTNRRRRTAPAEPSPLPPLYTRWIRSALGSLPPNETTATCNDCAMVAPPDVDPTHSANGLFFDPRVKCCTFVPDLPNFLVGRILLDRSPDGERGRASLRQRLANLTHATPLGVDSPPPFMTLYTAAGEALFGRAADLLCPHFMPENGGCGIYQHRMSTCCTWFCKYDRGERGRGVWESTRRLLRVVERVVAVHCLRTLEPGSVALEHALDASPTRLARPRAADLGGPQNEREHRRLWGRYAGREEAFFEACGRLASRLSWPQVRALGGAEIELALDVVRHARAETDATTLPRAVRLGAFTVAASTAESVDCTTTNAFDPLSIPRALFERLHFFDGRPTREVLAALKRDGVELSPLVVRKLVDHQFLVDASGV